MKRVFEPVGRTVRGTRIVRNIETGEGFEVEEMESTALRFTYGSGWEQRVNDGPWQPWHFQPGQARVVFRPERKK